MLQQTLSQNIESFGRKSLTLHANLKRKTSITYKSFITQAWNFTWNLQQCKKLSLTHLKLHIFNNSKSFLPHTSNFQWMEKLSSTHFHFETWYFQKTWRNLFHTFHTLRNGLLFSLQPCKLKTFLQIQRPFIHTPQIFNESKNSLPRTFTLKLDIFKNLKNKFFTLEKLTKLWKNLFHTSHSLRSGLLLFLQPCKLKAFPQNDSPFLCYIS